jgi:uncharacterized OsmC-like protein
MHTQKSVNGVRADRLFDTIHAIQEAPGLAKFQFRGQNRWENGARNRTTIQDFYGAGQEDTSRSRPYVFDADEPPVLLGENQGANPVEYALTALASCLTTSLVYHAAARGIELQEVESRLEGDLDLHGFLGMSDAVRNGFENIRVTFRIKADAPEQTLDELCQLAQKRSPVFDIISNPVPVTVRREKANGNAPSAKTRNGPSQAVSASAAALPCR